MINEWIDSYHNFIKDNLKEIYIEKYNLYIYALNIRDLDLNTLDPINVMPSIRYKKMMAYKHIKDRARHLGNELLFYYGLKKIYSIDLFEESESGIHRRVDKNGKPTLSGVDHIYFNMSHSYDYSVCAFSDQEIGVDIEKINKAHLGMAKRFFCDDEYNELCLLKEKDLDKKFYDYWVLKESLVKTTGLGLRTPLNSIKFENILNSQPTVLECTINNLKYHAFLLDHIKDYALAVCKKC